MTDRDYLSAWHQVVLPLAVEFEPQLVLVSAGFDPALGCPEGEQRVTNPCRNSRGFKILKTESKQKRIRVSFLIYDGFNSVRFPKPLLEVTFKSIREPNPPS